MIVARAAALAAAVVLAVVLPPVPAGAEGRLVAATSEARPASPLPSSPGRLGPRDPGRGAPAVTGQLPAAQTSRAFGLPVVLAVLMVLGWASLLVRVLLAEARLSDPEGSLRAQGGG